MAERVNRLSNDFNSRRPLLLRCIKRRLNRIVLLENLGVKAKEFAGGLQMQRHSDATESHRLRNGSLDVGQASESIDRPIEVTAEVNDDVPGAKSNCHVR